jgi:lipoprotein NlpI
MVRLAALCWITALLFAGPATAQFRGAVGNCFTGTGRLQLDIRECSLAIAADAHGGPSLASLYTQRGRAYLESDAPEAALMDFNAALDLNPYSAATLNQRGRAYHKGGDNLRAIADYDAALRLFPYYSEAFRNRGTAHLFGGTLDAAIADFDAALDGVNYDPASHALRGIAQYFQGRTGDAARNISRAIDMAYPYPQAAMWIYLANRDRAQLAANAQKLSEGNWPDPLIDAYLGAVSPDAALAAARGRRQRTQAYFYLGQLLVLNGDTAKARTFFDAAIELGVVDAIEYAGSILAQRQ